MSTNQPANYDRLASVYAFSEYLTFGSQLVKCREAWLAEVRTCQNILLLGDGDGRFSTRLLEGTSTTQLVSLDASLSMLTVARNRRKKREASDDRITNLHCDILQWSAPPHKFDAVVAQFFFDSFDQETLKKIVAKLKTTLEPTGRLVVSEFNIPKDTRIGNLRGRFTLGILYPLFKLITKLQTRQLADYRSLLMNQGFHLKNEVYFSQKTLVSQIFRLESNAQREISL